MLGPWTGAQCGQAPFFLPCSDQSKLGRLIFCHMTGGWIIAAGKLAGWLPTEQHINLTLCPGRDMLWPCDDIGHRPDVHPLVETSHGQVWYYCGQADLQSDVPPQTHETSGQVFIWSDVRSGQHHVRCTPQLKKLSGYGKMIDPCG